MLHKVVGFFSAVREMTALGCALIYVQARWYLWERWKADNPRGGPFEGPTDVV